MKKILLSLITFICFFLQLHAQEPGSLNKEGVKKGRKEEYKSARKRFNKAANIYDKESAIILHNQALLYEKRGQIDDAIASYQEAISRNPKQYSSYERLGYWHYKRGNYEKAVELGEKSLEINPYKPLAKKWLYDAYKKKVEAIKGRPYSEKEYYSKKKKKKQPVLKSHYRKYDPYRATFFGTFDFLVRSKYNPVKNSLGYQTSSGVITNFPYRVQAYYRPYEKVGFYGILENPYTGAASPNLSGQSERVEGRYYFKKLVIGGGLLLHHYADDGVFGSQENLTDFKLGSSVYYEDKESILELLIYPRLLLIDWSYNTGKTLDTSVLEYKYTYKYKPAFRYFVRLNQTDFYFFDHSKTRSHYWGYFDAAIGCSFDNYTFLKKTDLLFTIELAHRFNLEKTNVKKPYAFFNGQGLLGFDAGRSGGSLFSGQESESTLINARVDERFTSYFFLYQSLLIEFVGLGEDHHEFNLQLGAGYIL